MKKQFEVWSERLRGQSRMETAVGNALALASRPRLAMRVLTDAVVRDPLAKGPVISLGFLLGRSGPRDVEALWGRFRQTWSTLNLSDSRTFAAWLVGVEMLFHIDSDRAKSAIRNQFFPFFLRSELLPGRIEKPILLWHVPKTAGTTLAFSIAPRFYRSGTAFLPGYYARHVLVWIVQQRFDDIFPFLTSSHVSSSEIGVSPGEYRELVVLREPADRCFSAWKQYSADLYSRLWVLPQHGHLRNFFPRADLSRWAARAPSAVRNAYSYTFSTQERLASVSDKIWTRDLENEIPRLTADLRVPGGPVLLSSRRNVSRESRGPSSGELSILQNSCGEDQSLLDAFRR